MVDGSDGRLPACLRHGLAFLPLRSRRTGSYEHVGEEGILLLGVTGIGGPSATPLSLPRDFMLWYYGTPSCLIACYKYVQCVLDNTKMHC